MEGPIQAGDTAVILEDTVTTGGSSLRAVERAEAAGLRVRGVIAVVDRLPDYCPFGARNPLQAIYQLKERAYRRLGRKPHPDTRGGECDLTRVGVCSTCYNLHRCDPHIERLRQAEVRR